jgi:hypothetical protein
VVEAGWGGGVVELSFQNRTENCSSSTPTAVEAAPNLPQIGIDFIKNGRFQSADLLYWIAVLFWGWRVILLQGGRRTFQFFHMCVLGCVMTHQKAAMKERNHSCTAVGRMANGPSANGCCLQNGVVHWTRERVLL